MLTKEQKRAFRSDLFRHLDGLVTAPTAYALLEKGVLNEILKQGRVELSVLTELFQANEGYLNVALRVLCSQGWLDYELNKETHQVFYSLNSKSAVAFELSALYKDVIVLMKKSANYHPRIFNKEIYQDLEILFQKFQDDYGIDFSENEEVNAIQKQVFKHLEGIIIAPSIVALGMNGMFHKYFMEASFKPEEFHKEGNSFASLLNFFSFLGWFNKRNGTYSFTDKGLFFARRASAYGVTVSYQNTFRHLDELIFGNPEILWNVPKGHSEIHVDRKMNVWGSGGAHKAYFKKIDEIIIDLFNKPIHQQPKGIVDMGCGNGAYLEHLFEVIEQRTLRGSMLEDYPLFLVGADYNEDALKVTRANLINADIWAKVIWGDIGRPDILAKDLKDDYNIDLKDLLNVRTFLDHNRIWEPPKQDASGRISECNGSYAYRGQRITNNEVEQNLLEHLQKWGPYVEKFGLLVIELHTIPPELTAANLGRTAATAYDATHGFSDQYIIEVEQFNKIAAEAGLYPDENHFSKFPNSNLATVSINLLRGKS
ncbi:MAG: class I SAM-dependent methyltransferase [Saprospiraceae bacterium]|nr:class I SAM-dependent methyltransferase [Saprospiraceae bacterium]